MKRLLVLLIGIMPFTGLKATHLLGGEITWKCATGSNAGKYIFEMRLYRQCGTNTAGLGAFQTIQGPSGNISVNRTSQADVSPKCHDNTLDPDCYSGSSTTGRAKNAIEEHIYESSPYTLTGTPPTGGWEFYWTSCCRPNTPIIDNLQPQNQSYRLSAKMFPYTPPGASAPQSASTCYDNSPVFSTAPATVLCTGYPFTYNHNARDLDLDSLTYSWTPALQTTGASVSYATNTNTSQVTPRANGGGFIVPSPGFSFSVPLPWSAPPNLNTNNIPATINAKTGEINYTSFNIGHFATAIKVSEYRCQQLIGEISRDIPVFLIACPPPTGIPANVPPNVTFKDSLGAFIPLPAVDTVLAGTFVTFSIESTDFQFLYSPIRPQTNRLIPDGPQFGANFSDPNSGCEYTPCATLDTTLNYIDTAGYWEADFGVSTKFYWQTTCNHISEVSDCFVKEGVFTFVFKVQDNYCPVPGANFVTYTVVVIAPDDLAAPKLTCSKVAANGDVVLNWTQPVTAAEDSLNSFRSYVLWRSTHPDSPAVSVDTIWNINTTTYTDPGVYPSTNTYYYHLMGVSSCNDQSKKIWSDTIAAMHMDVTPYNGTSSAILQWSEFAPKGWPDKAIPQYDLYKIIGPDTTLIKSTTDTIDTLDIKECFPTTITFFVEVVDTTATWGCSSISELGSGVFGDQLPPPPNFIHTVTKDPVTDDLIAYFFPSTEGVIENYYIYDGSLNLIDSVTYPDTTYNFGPTAGNTGPETYSVSANDTCGNPGNPGPQHTTAFLQISGKDTCSISKKVSLTWSQYAYSTNIDYQEIWADTGTGWYKVDSVGPLVTTYDDVTIEGPRNYRYRLRTFFNGEVSVSNFVSIYVAKIIDGTLIDPPVINCVSVLPNGDIRIEWTKPTNNTKNSFDSYHIYHSEDGIAFNVIDSIKGFVAGDNLAFDTTGYTHAGVFCETDHYYRVESRSGCFGRNYSAPSNTIQAMCLEATEVNEKVNDIVWTPIFTGAPPSSLDANYTVWKEYPVGTTPAILRSIPFGTNATTDTIITCDDSARYYVTINDLTKGCTSVSSIDAGYYYDDVPPVTQLVDSVSVIEDSVAIIGWSPNTSIDVGGYYVLRQLPQGLFQILDTITTLVPPLTYEDRDNILDGVSCYTVSAFDNCGNNVLLDQDFDYHCNIEPETKLNECDGLINVTWNAYSDFTSGNNVVYQVYLSVNSGKYELLATTTASNYVYSNPVNGNNYRFYIRAVENGGAGPYASTSLKSDQEVDIPPRPEYAYLRNVTVSDSNSIRVELWIDLNGSIGEYWVGRSINGDSSTYQIVSTIELPDPVTPADSMFRFEDTKVEANVHSYYYKIDVMDKCKDPAIISNVARSMKLSVSADRGKNENELKWNRYEGYNGGVREYRVYRGTDNTQPILVRTLPEESLASFGEIITFRDDVSDVTDGNKGQFCYYVEAVEGFPFFGNLDEAFSRSNEVCAIQYPLFYVPTAFTPNGDGINDTFKPDGVFFDFDQYKMSVYNRWGEEIFTSEDVNIGWDGTYEDREMTTGGYVYLIFFKSADGEEFEQKGTITLTR